MPEIGEILEKMMKKNYEERMRSREAKEALIELKKKILDQEAE